MTGNLVKFYTKDTIPDAHAYPYMDPTATQQESRRQRLVERTDAADWRDTIEFEGILLGAIHSERAAIFDYHERAIAKQYGVDDLKTQLRYALLCSRVEHFLWWQKYRDIADGKIGNDRELRAFFDAMRVFESYANSGKGSRRLAVGALRSYDRTLPVKELLASQRKTIDCWLAEGRSLLKGAIFDGREFRADARFDVEAAAIPLEAFLIQETQIELSSQTAKDFIYDCLSLFDRSVTRTAVVNLHKQKSDITSILAERDPEERRAFYCHLLDARLHRATA